MSRHLSPKELHNLEITERVASCFSLVGTGFILFTFLYSPAFRKPVNRLIFYASWGYVPLEAVSLSSPGIESQDFLALSNSVSQF